MIAQQAGNRGGVCLIGSWLWTRCGDRRPEFLPQLRPEQLRSGIEPIPPASRQRIQNGGKRVPPGSDKSASLPAQRLSSQHRRNTSVPAPSRSRVLAAHPIWVRAGCPGRFKSTLHSALRSQAAAVTPPTSRRHRTYAPHLPPAHPFWVQVGSPKLRQANITFNATPLFGAPQQYKRRLPIPLQRVTPAHPKWVRGCADGLIGWRRGQTRDAG
jgi:hypothetical protein